MVLLKHLMELKKKKLKNSFQKISDAQILINIKLNKFITNYSF